MPKAKRRPPPDAHIGNEARMLHSRLQRAERRAAEAEQEALDLQLQLAQLHARLCERFGRDVPQNALLLDVLEQIEVEDGDVWRWRGRRNNHDLPTLRINRAEKSVIRYLAIEFGVISEDDFGLLYPTGGDPEDINPWHRRMRASTRPIAGQRWDFDNDATGA